MSLFALLLLAVSGFSGEADAGLVEVYVNDSEDLVTSEEDVTIPYGTDFIVTYHIGGPYRIESGDDNLSLYSIITDVHFLSDTDRRDTCTMCAVPNLKPLGDTDADPGYDTYQATFFSDMVAFEGYRGDIQFSIIMKNRTSGIVWDNVFEIEIVEESTRPTAHWSFDEGEGTTVYDSGATSGSNNGTLQNDPVWVDGINGTAIEFDGVDDYVEIADSDSLDLGSKLTFSAWIKLDSFPDNNRASIILSKYDTLDNQRSYMFFIRNTNSQISLRAVVSDGTDSDGGKCNYDSIYPFKTGIFYHVAATYNNDAGDSNRWHLFVNGTEIENTVISENSIVPKNSTAPLAIGKVFDGEHPGEPKHFFDGVIDEVMIWDRNLSSDEILNVYNENYTPPPPPCQTGDTKLADDGFNQCVCTEGKWICTDVVCDDCEKGEQGLPSISLIPALISIGFIAILRRR